MGRFAEKCNQCGHLAEALNIPAISAVYTEAHNTSHARTRLQGDKIINDVLDVTLAREDTYTHSAQTTTEAEKVFQETLQLNTVDGEIPTFTGARARQLTNKLNVDIRTKVRNATRPGVQERLSNHAKNLQVQGNLLTLAKQEKEDLIWKSSMSQLKSGTLKFMLNACINTLLTPANLIRWKYTSSDKCKLCGNRGTTNHYPNCCKVIGFGSRYFMEQKSKRIELTLTSSVSRALSHRKTMIFHDQGVIRVITVEMFFMNMDSKVIFA